METNKNEFLQTIANAESYALALSDLLEAATQDHFAETLEEVIAKTSAEKDDGAFRWMISHYKSISATTYAANIMAETLYGMFEDLWTAAKAIVPEESVHTMPKGGIANPQASADLAPAVMSC